MSSLAITRPGTAPGLRPQGAFEPLTSDWEERWDQFVEQHPHGSPFHTMAWMRSIQATFGFRPYYSLLLNNGEIAGIFPLFLVASRIRAKALISTPFAVYGGVLADSEAAIAAAREYVLGLGAALGVDYIELRNRHESQGIGLTPVPRYVTFTQELTDDEDGLLNMIPRKTRAVVRKSLKSGFETRQSSDFAAFQDLYSSNLRRLGTPSFPARHFENLIRYFGERVNVREVLHNGQVAAAVFSFQFREQVLPYYGAADGRFNAQGASTYMYFDQMRCAAAQGFRVFDFGRSKKENSGSYDFKSHWGMRERELPYEMDLVRGKTLPNYTPNNPKYAFFIRTWQKLPLWLTRKIGPKLIQLFP
jgi:FemAB-related protein (PEP-CTERM system-associated)